MRVLRQDHAFQHNEAVLFGHFSWLIVYVCAILNRHSPPASGKVTNKGCGDREPQFGLGQLSGKKRAIRPA